MLNETRDGSMDQYPYVFLDYILPIRNFPIHDLHVCVIQLLIYNSNMSSKRNPVIDLSCIVSWLKLTEMNVPMQFQTLSAFTKYN